ncbi:MAG: D-alanine--D-alanine ligase [Desulfobacteraceae bacterium]|nr:D-alanine--D-alanine ligase [Desulfobacteraceae bacterium]MCF8094486.1 D-alanine--D-alanine ligase [Desulfobacteraceae bacterium]
MKKLNVALLSGGTSGEREISLKGGDQAYEALDKSRYNVMRYDPGTDLARLATDAADIDAALVIVHGVPGEDGTIQGMLDLMEIPYQCTGVLGSAIAMNKLVSKFFYEKAGIPGPKYISCSRGQSVDASGIINRLGLPLVIKPASGGSSLGMSIVRSAGDCEDALAAAFACDDTVIAEEYLAGTEITGGVLGNDELEALPIIEIVPKNAHEFFDYDAKYRAGETDEICPARIDEGLAKTAQNLAEAAHRALFCSGCSRTDMIISNGRIHVLETNTIPGMTSVSLLPLAAKTAGISYAQLLDRMIELAIEKRTIRTKPETKKNSSFVREKRHL